MSLKNGNRNKKNVPVQLSPEDASVMRMKTLEQCLMTAMSSASKEIKKNNLGDLTIFETTKILSRIQHHYADIGVKFQWEQADEHNKKVIEESKVVPINGEKLN